ncbi:hypothetical protein N0U24_17865 [Peribacillus frigoritolerans]|uniref:hypothetical protein n=1 Tax=Peribacillus frigoritolerans TaxID=450367 RepID=UPI0021AAAF17|nr:hypothetical protein [Peribacillus frigoritolerans]MCT4478982.1 hypothetical protein [Peribacillus frigoritolerans]
MKKTLIIIIFLLSVLVGCSNGDKYMKLSGESDHWKGEYVATATEDSENGTYTFKYKDVASDVFFKTLEISINDGETKQKTTNYNEPTVEIQTACSGCSVTNESMPIHITINWDGNEESFTLKQSK